MTNRRSHSTLIVFTVLLASCGPASPPDPDGHAGTATSSSAAHAVERSDWRLAEPADGNTLRIVVPIPGAVSCGSFDRVDVSETADSVSIETFIRRRIPGEGEACTDDLAFEQISVDLERDLGERRLEGCDAPPEGNVYFSQPLAPEGCVEAVLDSE